VAAFLISIADILNSERYQAYGAGLVGVTERAGGRYVLRGWCTEVLEGDAKSGSRVVVVAYDDPAGIERYANDSALVAAKPLMGGAVSLRQMVVEQSAVSGPDTERTGTFLVISAWIEDVQAYLTYAVNSKAVALSHGGEYLVLGPVDRRIDGEVLEPGLHRAVIIQFQNAEAALRYRDDPDYRAARAMLGHGAALIVRLVKT